VMAHPDRRFEGHVRFPGQFLASHTSLYGEFARNSVSRYQELELAVSQLRTLG
jgi:hypothetical protein